MTMTDQDEWSVQNVSISGRVWPPVGGGNLTTLVIPVQLPGKIDPWCMHEVGNAENCEYDHADADVDNDADVDAEIRDGENPGMPN